MSIYTSSLILYHLCASYSIYTAIYFVKCRFDIVCCIKSQKEDNAEYKSLLERLFESFYAPFLLNKWVKPVVVVLFFGWLCTSIAVAPKLEVGLDQEQYSLKLLGQIS
jgi:tRNA uridine 5-carbamoylmethylation protein Kti12